MRVHHRLEAWQEAMALAEEVYRLTYGFPKEEAYGLTSQMRRAAVSVPSNIAEGAARGSNKEFLHYLLIARGSLSELDTQLLLADRLSYLSEKESTMVQIEKVFALLGGLVKSVKSKALGVREGNEE